MFLDFLLLMAVSWPYIQPSLGESGWMVCVVFALTLTLSPRRGDPWPVFTLGLVIAESCQAASSYNPMLLLVRVCEKVVTLQPTAPSPGGEGWGEGEIHCLNSL